MQHIKNTIFGQQNVQNNSLSTTRSFEQPLPATTTYPKTVTLLSPSEKKEENASGPSHGNISPELSTKDGSAKLIRTDLHEMGLQKKKEINLGNRVLDEVSAIKKEESSEKPRPAGKRMENFSSNGQMPVPLRYSTMPPPPLTDLDFWGALVKHYECVSQRLPTLLLKKMRSGIPAPLRGIVWLTISGARGTELELLYDEISADLISDKEFNGDDSLCIFPGVDMFRDPLGDGQQILQRVLKAFSLYDKKISYCRGLAYIVGPLLIFLGEKHAFSVLVRLMRNYDMGDCFLPDFSALNLRIYQYHHLLKQHLPSLSNHFNVLRIEPTYAIQWFLSFFAITCPLPMLFRIYDVLFAEGASVTVMRVALSLMRRNEKKITACKEVKDVKQLLASKGLWDVYNYNADEFVNEFMSLAEIVTFDVLKELEVSYIEAQASNSIAFSERIASSANKFLFEPSKNQRLDNTLSKNTLSRESIELSQRSSSKQSFASSVNSSNCEVSDSLLSSGTDLSSISANTSIANKFPALFQPPNISFNRHLPDQVEELLTTLSELQKENSILTKKLLVEREERIEDFNTVRSLIVRLRKNIEIEPQIKSKLKNNDSEDLRSYLDRVESRFSPSSHQRSSLQQSKSQLREELICVTKQLEIEMSKTQEFSRQFLEQGQEIKSLQQQVKQVHLHIRHSYQENQRLERVNQELRKELQAKEQENNLSDVSLSTGNSVSHVRSVRSGLRTLKLSHNNSSEFHKVHSKHSSVLGVTSKSVFANLETSVLPKVSSAITVESDTKQKDNENEVLILELVRAKTAEAMAREDADNLRNQIKLLKNTVTLSSKYTSVIKPSTKETETINKSFTPVNLSSPEDEVNMTSNPLPTSVSISEEAPSNTLAHSSSVLGPDSSPKTENSKLSTKLKVSETTSKSSIATTYNPPSRFGLYSNERDESISPQSSFRRTEASKNDTGTASYSSFSRFGRYTNQKLETKMPQASRQTPTILDQKTARITDNTQTPNYSSLSRFGRYTNQKLETKMPQASEQTPKILNQKNNPTTDNSETPRYSSFSRFGRYTNQKSETKIPQASEQSPIASDIKSAPRPGLGPTNLATSTASERSELSFEIESHLLNSKAETKIPPATEPTHEATPQPAATDSASKTEDEGNALGLGIKSYLSNSKAEVKVHRASEITAEATLEPAVADSASKIENKGGASGFGIAGFFSTSKVEAKVPQASEPTLEASTEPTTTKSVVNTVARDNSKSFGFGSYFSSSKSEAKIPPATEPIPEVKLGPVVTDSASKNENKSSALGLGIGSYFSTSKAEAKVPQVSEPTHELPTGSVQADSSKTENKGGALGFGIGGFFSMSKVEAKVPEASEPTPEASTEPSPTTTNSMTNALAEGNAKSFGFGSFFSSTKTETKKELAPVTTPVPSKPVVDGSKSFWGGWGKKS